MKRRKWTAKDKLNIVLQRLKGEITIAELCNRHQISQTQYYKWRDRLVSDGAKVFEHHGPARAEEVWKLLSWNGGGMYSSGVGIGCIDFHGKVHADQFWWHYDLGDSWAPDPGCYLTDDEIGLDAEKVAELERTGEVFQIPD